MPPGEKNKYAEDDEHAEAKEEELDGWVAKQTGGGDDNHDEVAKRHRQKPGGLANAFHRGRRLRVRKLEACHRKHDLASSQDKVGRNLRKHRDTVVNAAHARVAVRVLWDGAEGGLVNGELDKAGDEERETAEEHPDAHALEWGQRQAAAAGEWIHESFEDWDEREAEERVEHLHLVRLYDPRRPKDRELTAHRHCL